MSIYLILAYGVFCAVPLGLALSIALRRRRVERAIARSTAPDESQPNSVRLP